MSVKLSILRESQWQRPYGAGAAAVATVVCDLEFDGSFRTNAMPAFAGEVEKERVLHLDFCLRARTAFLVGFDRSILRGVEWRVGERRGKETKRERLEWLRSSLYGDAVTQAGRGRFLDPASGVYCGVVDLGWMSDSKWHKIRIP